MTRKEKKRRVYFLTLLINGPNVRGHQHSQSEPAYTHPLYREYVMCLRFFLLFFAFFVVTSLPLMIFSNVLHLNVRSRTVCETLLQRLSNTWTCRFQISSVENRSKSTNRFGNKRHGIRTYFVYGNCVCRHSRQVLVEKKKYILLIR